MAIDDTIHDRSLSTVNHIIILDNGTLCFRTKGRGEVLRFEANGDVYVRDEKVDSNRDVYAAHLEWFEMLLDKRPTPITDRARKILAPVKHLIDFARPQVDDLIKDIEVLENVFHATTFVGFKGE